jgi:GTP-binding protein HflX
VDTVGFINKLPHDLVDAFRATLEETRTADLLLHVVDSSSENRERQMETVKEVLKHLGADNKPMLTVYNKTDVICGETVIPEKDSVEISAKTGAGIDELKSAVRRKLSEARVEVSVVLPLDSGGLVSRVYAGGQVTGCRYAEDGIHLTAVVTQSDAARLCEAAI